MSTSASGQAPPEPPPPAAPDADLAPGTRVGEYLVDGKLGEGGFGAVFRASHPLIGKQVAIKVLSQQYSANPQMVSRFIAEARAVNQIRHRHIIDIFSFGQLPDGRHYYVMELLAGRTLDVYLGERGGRLSLADAIPIFLAIAKALDAAHAKGIAHRDLKPENVFISDDDGAPFAKLLDFGIAKLLGTSDPKTHKTRTGVPMGTPYYMSPEQCRGRDIDHRTDLYSFGILAYQLLTGRVPFDGDDYMDILLKQVSASAAPPSSLVADLPPDVDQILAELMAKDASQRPNNLLSAVRALEDIATRAGLTAPGGPTPTTLVTPVTANLSAPTSSRRWLLPTAGLALVLVAAATWLATRPTLTSSASTAGQGRAPAATVTLAILGVPDGTEIIAADGTILTTTPKPLTLPRATTSMPLTLRHPGFRLHRTDLIPDHDQSLTVTLVALDPAPTPTADTPAPTPNAATPAPAAPPASLPAASPPPARAKSPLKPSKAKDKNALEDFD